MMSKHVICQNLIIFFLCGMPVYVPVMLFLLFFFSVSVSVQVETSPIHEVDLKKFENHAFYVRQRRDVLLRHVFF